jgi:hypothetical protein
MPREIKESRSYSLFATSGQAREQSLSEDLYAPDKILREDSMEAVTIVRRFKPTPELINAKISCKMQH